jgi:inosine-uridine nucleoside N-ribohydrolase
VKEKIIIDTDPGVDDALAIAFGIKARLPIESICTVYGNSTLENCSSNALTILEIVGSDVPVYRGADKPLKGINRLAQSHGDNGLGGFSIETTKKISEVLAIDHYQDILARSEKDEVSIIAIGPTTNLGLLMEKSPELLEKAKKIIVMGGVFGEKGNVTLYAEFNVFNDPYALDSLLRLGKSKIIIVPANICRKVTFNNDVFNQIKNPELAAGLSKISQIYIDYYSKDKEFGGFDGGVMYDLLAVALEVDSTLFTFEKVKINVETKDSDKFGLTEIIPGEPNCEVVTDVDVEELKKLYISVMNR